MNALALPKRVESDVMNYASGRTVTLKKDFLETGLAMNQPMIRRMWLRGQANVDTSAGSGGAVFLGGMLSHIYDRIVLKDRSGERINVSGGELRAIAQLDLGIGYRDPDDIAGNANDLDVEFRIPFVFTLADRAGSPDDSAMLLADFYSGGELTINFRSGTVDGGSATAPALTINSMSVTVEAEIVDAGNMVAPSRLSWLSTALLNKDSSYPINGKLRTAFLYVGTENEESGDTWDSAGETLESRSLNYIALSQTGFSEAYLEEGYQRDEIDMVANNFVLPLFYPKRGDKITDMPVFDNLHVKFSQALPDQATLITGVWTQRSDATVALAFRGIDPGQLMPLLKSGGVVPGLRGDAPAASFPGSQRKYLPIKLTKSAAAAPPSTPVGQAVR